MTSTSVTVRRVAAVPERTASNTWRAIADLIAAPGSTAHATLLRAAGVASLLIAEAYTRDVPIVVTPATGSRVRVYTVHGQDAAADAISEEAPLATWPTAEPGWSVSLPCGEADLQFAADALAKIPEISARDAALGLALDDDARQHASTATAGPAPLRVDTSWLEK